MARTKRPAVKGRVFTVEEINNLSNIVLGGTSGGKPRKAGGNGITPSQTARWHTRLAETKEWVNRKGRFPRRSSSPQYEMYLATWLYNNLPGSGMYRAERMAKLNQAFGAGWHEKFCPRLERNERIVAQREVRWENKLAAVQKWICRKGQFPSRGTPNRAENALGRWLYDNLPGRQMHRPERWSRI